MPAPARGQEAFNKVAPNRCSGSWSGGTPLFGLLDAETSKDRQNAGDQAKDVHDPEARNDGTPDLTEDRQSTNDHDEHRRLRAEGLHRTHDLHDSENREEATESHQATTRRYFLPRSIELRLLLRSQPLTLSCGFLLYGLGKLINTRNDSTSEQVAASGNQVDNRDDD